MKSFVKNLGPLIMLIGVAILATYFFTQSNSNAYLTAAAVLNVVGFLGHIVINKAVK